jgi:hypothetical protein
MDQYTEDGTINEITLNIVRNKVFDKLLETAKVKDVKVKEEKAETPEKKGRKDAKKKTKAKKKS